MNQIIDTKPRLGFAGVGWIGKNRLDAIMKQNISELGGILDANQELLQHLAREMPDTPRYPSFEAMLDSDLDGIVIATPSAMHAPQALAALESGKAVFCQKPLGRNAVETSAVVEAARVRNLLLGVDFSYRYTQAIQAIKKVITSGELGKIYGIQLTFHNAYGPDKAWYHDPALSGGGCLMDLGIHLVDLLFWLFDEITVTDVYSSFFQKGKRLRTIENAVEDYAACQMTLNGQASVQLACSWFLPAGKEAVIEASFYGENGGVAFRNVQGSFYNFVAERFYGTTTETLATPPDDWGGQAAVLWAEALANGEKFNPAAQTYVKVSQVLDALYQHGA